MNATMLDATGASPKGKLSFSIKSDGFGVRMTLGAGMYLGTETDPGTIGDMNATRYFVGGTVGADFASGAITNLTVVKGIVTAAS